LKVKNTPHLVSYSKLSNEVYPQESQGLAAVGAPQVYYSFIQQHCWAAFQSMASLQKGINTLQIALAIHEANLQLLYPNVLDSVEKYCTTHLSNNLFVQHCADKLTAAETLLEILS
jgi:hypothetical protein